jgi:formylglycine-generating enzyme required for sulfatase activity
MTWFQAQQACEAAGKRLCSNAEWQAAVAGTHDPGATSTGNQCVVSASEVRDSGLAGDTPGGTTSCVSIWGADDMIGNAWEWVADWDVAGLDWQTGDGTSACQSGCNVSPAGWPAGYGGDATWNVDGRAHDGSSYVDGLLAAARRGGNWTAASGAGAFAVNMGRGPSNSGASYGARCCRR